MLDCNSSTLTNMTSLNLAMCLLHWSLFTHIYTLHIYEYYHLWSALLNTWLNLAGLFCKVDTVLGECRHMTRRKSCEENTDGIGNPCFSLVYYSVQGGHNQLPSVLSTNQP